MTEFLATSDGALGVIAGRQHGLVTARQALGVGLDKDAIAWRVRSGRLHPMHRGVYAVGHAALSWRGRWMAAVLAAGDSAVLSHHSAAALWKFTEPIEGLVQVSVPGDGGRLRRRRGLLVHRSRTLGPRVITRRHGIPVTIPARTIADLERTVEPYLLRRAVRQAEVNGHRLGSGVTVHHTRSDLELDFLGFCRRHRIPAPEVNVRVGRFEVDFLWRQARLAVETDSWDYHRGSVAFEDDHEGDLELRRRGIDLVRVTGRQLAETPELIAGLLTEPTSRS